MTPGQQLVIPRAPSLLVAARADAVVPEPVEARTTPRRATPRQVDAVSADARPSRTSARPAATPAKTTYRVKSGDTLGSIARTFGTTVSSLRKWNRLRGNLVRVGDRNSEMFQVPLGQGRKGRAGLVGIQQALFPSLAER